MHKITKGIKKKIKSKKGHKGEDLFDPAELEKYRREKEEREAAAAAEVEAGGDVAGAAAAGGQGEEEGEEGPPKQEDEEWQRFKLLTAGVDSVLKKTQGDLDRIKSTSYFQRKKPGPSDPGDHKGPAAAAAAEAPVQGPSKESKAAAGAKPKRWVGFEEGAPIDEPPPPEEEEVGEEEEVAKEEVKEEEAEEEPEEEEEEDPGEEDIFDTSYVDVVASGEVKLAYIPESPTEEGPAEDDPFDTSIAEKVIGPEPPKGKKQRQLVSLGCAVEVLTGRLDQSQAIAVTQSSKKRRVAPSRRPEDVDLFILDEEAQPKEPSAGEPSEEEVAPRSRRASADPFGVLEGDEVPDVTPVGEALTTVPPQPAEAPQKTEGEVEGEETHLKDLVAEFDIIGEVDTAKAEEELIFGKKAEENKEEEDEFAALAAESVKRSPAPPTVLNLEEDVLEEEDDPFDTSAAAGVLGELPATPQKVLPSRPPRQVSSPDVDVLLGGGEEPPPWEDFGQEVAAVSKGPPPLRPNPPSSGPPPRPSQPPARPPAPDGGFSPGSRGQPPLAFTETAIEEITRDLDSRFESAEGGDDPFDTSFAEVAAAPGRAELRLIESEILGDVEEEFDPRAGEGVEVQSSVTIHISLPREEEGAEEVFGERETERRVPPPQPKDLFDSAEEGGEEFASSLQLSHRDLLGGSTTDLSKLGHDPISPDEVIEQTVEEEVEDYIDPFDTSIVDPRIAPGKAELKILEKELLGEVETPPVAEPSGLKRVLSDPDFDPRGSEEEGAQPAASDAQPSLDLSKPDLLEAENRLQEATENSDLVLSPSSRPDLLSVSEAEVEFSKPLTPLVEEGEKISEAVLKTDGVDPFDTTFAENILPGKAELRIIESELFGQPDVTSGAGITRCLSDPDFDPRGGSEESQASSGQAGATVHQQRRHSDVSAFGGAESAARALPPTTLPLQNVANPAPEPIRQAPPDLLAVEEEEPEAARPLSPARQAEEDPFDTSAVSVSVLRPGKAELKALESELFGAEEEPTATSNFHASITAQILVTQLQATSQAPVATQASVEEKAPDLLNLPEVEEDAPAGPKPLTPLVETSDFPIDEDYDPFDTSIAEGIGPGRTELKLLESELIGQ